MSNRQTGVSHLTMNREFADNEVFWVSFGQGHKHTLPSGVVLDKDCLGTLAAKSEEAARNKVTELFGEKYCMLYTVRPQMKRFPKGQYKI